MYYSQLVFKVSRTFSTRLTLSESFEIDSTHSTFSTPKWLYKNQIFENFILEVLYAKIFKLLKIMLKIVISTLRHKNYTYLIEKLPIWAILQIKYCQNRLKCVHWSRLCSEIDSESTQSESEVFDSLDSLRLTLEHYLQYSLFT